jgi:heat shock protein HslJ
MEPDEKTGKLPFLPVIAGLLILIPILIAAGCTGTPPAPADIPLEGTGWTLREYAANGTLQHTLNDSAVTLVFGNDGQITGSAGCNHYFAPFGIKGKTITAGPAGSTEMFCIAPGVMEQESAYLALLGKSSSFSGGNDTLTFADAAGTTILTFTRIVPPEPEPLAGTNWTLDSIYSGDAVSSVIAGTTITAVFDGNGSVTGSAGCNRFFASCNVTGSSMTIGPAGSTRMFCNGPGIMQQETAYLASLGRVAAFSLSGDRLNMADANGAPLLSFRKAP